MRKIQEKIGKELKKSMIQVSTKLHQVPI